MDEQVALRGRLEEFKKDREAMRAFNAKVASFSLRRFERGSDSIEALRQRVADITSRPESQPHTIWNARNFLEQVEAAMEAEE